jgi:hypothetical protein
MSEKSEYFTETFDLSLLLEFNLSPHERELFLYFVAGEILSNLEEGTTGILDLARSDQLSR